MAATRSTLPASARIRRRDRLASLAVSALLLVGLAWNSAVPARAAAIPHFDVSITGDQAAGTAFDVTVTAKDASDNVDTTYDGTVTLSGLADSPGGDVPVYGDFTWSGGVGTASVTAFKAQSDATLTATDTADSARTGTSNSFAVAPGSLAQFAFAHVDDTTAGQPFNATVTAYDSYGNVVTTYSGSAAALSGLSDSPGCACSPVIDPTPATYGTPAWSGGVRTYTGVVAYAATTSMLTITDSGVSGSSNSFAVAPAAGLAGFTFDAPPIGTKSAGSTIDVHVTAHDAYGNVATGYDGSGASLSGLGNSPGCDACSPALPTATPTIGDGAWVGGHGTWTGTIAVAAGTSAQLTVADGTISKSSNTFEVDNGPDLAGFTIDPITDPETAGTSFVVTIHAYDTYGNPKTDYHGGGLSGLADSLGCPDCSPVLPVASPTYGSITWVAGVGTAHVTAVNAQSAAQLLISDGDVSNSSNAFTVNPASALAGFTTAHVDDMLAGPGVAGTGFAVTATAYDLYGNVNTNYSGGAALSGLDPSPGCTGCLTTIAPKAPAYGTATWSGGVGTYTGVTAYFATKSDAATGYAHVTITDGTTGVSNTTNDFVVSPIGVKAVWFSGQPIDTQVNTSLVPSPVYSLCAPSTSSPCAPSGAGPNSSSPVAVTAVDDFGNLVLRQDIEITGSGLDAAVTSATSSGVATFGDSLKESTTGNGRRLTATAALNGSATRPSGVFRVVTTLKACGANQTTCTIKAMGNTGTKTYVNFWSQITTGTSFFGGGTNVLQSTQLVLNSSASQCGVTKFASDLADQRVTGQNTQVTSSGYELIVIPKATLKASGLLNRAASTFNVCFGAIWIGDGSPTQGWLAKRSATSTTLVRATPVSDTTVVPQGQRWYGIPADCGTRGLTPSDPCIALKTKQKAAIQTLLGSDAASIMTDADIGLVVRVGGSWDGGSHPF